MRVACHRIPYCRSALYARNFAPVGESAIAIATGELQGTTRFPSAYRFSIRTQSRHNCRGVAGDDVPKSAASAQFRGARATRQSDRLILWPSSEFNAKDA